MVHNGLVLEWWEISEEQLIHSNPDYYLMTAADWDSTRKGSASKPLGYTGINKVFSPACKLMDRPKFRSLSAYKNKQVLALYQQYSIRHLTLLRWKRLQNLSTQSCLQTLIRKQIAITYTKLSPP